MSYKKAQADDTLWEHIAREAADLFEFMLTTERALLDDIPSFKKRMPMLMDIYEVAKEKSLIAKNNRPQRNTKEYKRDLL